MVASVLNPAEKHHFSANVFFAQLAASLGSLELVDESGHDTVSLAGGSPGRRTLIDRPPTKSTNRGGRRRLDANDRRNRLSHLRFSQLHRARTLRGVWRHGGGAVVRRLRGQTA